MGECNLNPYTIAHALSVIYSKRLGYKVTFVLTPKDGTETLEEPTAEKAADN